MGEFIIGSSAKLKRTLKTRHLVFLGIAFMAPAAVFDTFGIASEITNGHVPLAYVMAFIAILFTAASYGKMVKAFPFAGSAYTYAQRAISPNVGFMVGWLVLLDYLFLPLLNALLTGIYMSSLFPTIPFWVWVSGFIIVITLINMANIKFAANFNIVLVLFQVFFILFFIVLVAQRLLNGEGTGELFTISPFLSENMDISLVIIGASILCQSFLGFDAVSTLSEETENPTKVIPRAIFIVASVGGLLFIVVSYFSQSLFPNTSNFKDIDSASTEMSFYLGGLLFQAFFTAGAIVGNIASGLASQASGARLLYVMGRENVLPKCVFGYVHPKLGSPTINVVLIGILSFLALALSLETAVSFINFGALVAFSFVNISVIAHYSIRLKQHRTPLGFINYFLAPLLGAACLMVLWWNLESNSFYLGMSWGGVGFIYLLIKTKMFTYSAPLFKFGESV